ncbi:MAG TPA: ABC transporter ATP-binding protein [Methanospirillum sp.]|nr:ABC transporter ATP-binding protein [Methanospirillum sp.]
MTSSHILRVSDLWVRFITAHGEVSALSSFSCVLSAGEVVAIVGESGCGKSVAAHAIMRILPHTAHVSGGVEVCGRDVHTYTESEMNRIRGGEIAILFQNPDRSLNPLYRIGRQIREPLLAHRRKMDRDTTNQLLIQAGCEDPDDISQKYPCQCSGGMNQRALLAIVSGLNPRIFIADEPTKGLDRDRVSDVARSLQMMRAEDRGILLITHDIILARTLSDRVMIMYAGEVVESGSNHAVFSAPRHPYTRSLLRSLPEHGFIPIPGMSPGLSDLPVGCRFAPRCHQATTACHTDHPDLILADNREVRCPRC